MKKILTLLLIGVMLFSFSGCKESHRRTTVVIGHGYASHHRSYFRPMVNHRSSIIIRSHGVGHKSSHGLGHRKSSIYRHSRGPGRSHNKGHR